jgi:hypothetical protein
MGGRETRQLTTQLRAPTACNTQIVVTNTDAWNSHDLGSHPLCLQSSTCVGGGTPPDKALSHHAAPHTALAHASGCGMTHQQADYGLNSRTSHDMYHRARVVAQSASAMHLRPTRNTGGIRPVPVNCDAQLQEHWLLSLLPHVTLLEAHVRFSTTYRSAAAAAAAAGGGGLTHQCLTGSMVPPPTSA